jgi:hypothetical protein
MRFFLKKIQYEFCYSLKHKLEKRKNTEAQKNDPGGRVNLNRNQGIDQQRRHLPSAPRCRGKGKTEQQGSYEQLQLLKIALMREQEVQTW